MSLDCISGRHSTIHTNSIDQTISLGHYQMGIALLTFPLSLTGYASMLRKSQVSSSQTLPADSIKDREDILSPGRCTITTAEDRGWPTDYLGRSYQSRGLQGVQSAFSFSFSFAWIHTAATTVVTKPRCQRRRISCLTSTPQRVRFRPVRATYRVSARRPCSGRGSGLFRTGSRWGRWG